MEQTHELLLLGRPGCCLCAELLERAEPLLAQRGWTLREADVDSDLTWREQFGLRIPVLLHRGVVLVEGRVTEQQLAAALERLA